MAAPQASSRLEMLQARFQQKQLQEKEQKLLQLYDQQQQRAYQVVQRGSAGSNGSNHSSSVTHQTVTRTSSNSHTTSTSQGGKVRQMFDERRQTTVKGVDRSYPLEPLENKPRKQTSGNGVVVPSQKNGNLTVSRQSVIVKRVGRADLNSNLNAGKPVVSYHEEITRESFGPQLRQQEQENQDENEFGNENYGTQHTNGNIPHDDHHQILDQDTIDNNRMMAKLHLMEFDETMKHRIRNDLESEEFPEELMVDVPDKLPKRTATKKLSQAEARLERFKNANARRSNVTKNTTPTTVNAKKRSETVNSLKFTHGIAKSPSPDPVVKKSTDTSSRATRRRSVPLSPSSSPDTTPRRTSSDMKTQETKASRCPMPTKPAEAGSKKTTINRKSTNAVDGVVLENGLHSREQVVEGKQDNSPTPKKADAFMVEFEDGISKEGYVVPPKKPLLRKQSGEKQTSPTHSTRPVSSISSVSSGSSAQGQTSGPKGKMATRARTPISGTSSSKAFASGKSAGSANAADNLVPCKVCGRRFAHERITLHEQICTRTAQKKRKQFDTMMYRVKGTDLEPFVKKGIAKKQPEKPEVKSNWRRKHEDFINAIRSAKQVQAHLAAGGKLSDLPPPPASDTSDYIQCPHCGRKFNQAAAERHIPKCEHMLHNKPVHSRTPKLKR